MGVNRYDVRAVQSGGRVGFATEPLLKHFVSGGVGGQNFDRDDSVEDGVVGSPDFAHAATAQQID